jgi:hypothetical protein
MLNGMFVRFPVVTSTSFVVPSEPAAPPVACCNTSRIMLIWSSSRVEGDDGRTAAALPSTEGPFVRVALFVSSEVVWSGAGYGFDITFEYWGGGRMAVTNKINKEKGRGYMEVMAPLLRCELSTLILRSMFTPKRFSKV